jgi:UDP-glucose 4-epimerase
MKILVTGGAGFIGAHLVKKLIDINHKVLVVDNLKVIGGIPYIHPKCKFLKGDILNSRILKQIKNWKPEIIYHLAAQSAGESAYDDPKNDYLSNGYGTYLLSLLAKKLKVKKFIYTSTVAVYGSNTQKKINEKTKINPDSIYGISKYAGELFINQILKNTNVQTLIFRVFNTYGPGENLNYLKKGMVSIYCSYLWRNKPILVKGSLNRFRNYQYIDDIINIFVLSLKNKSLKKNEIINLSTAKAVTVKNLLKIIFKINNKKNHKIKETTGTPGDSFGFDSSNKYLKSKFKNYRFISLEKGLKLYFKWIKKVPLVKDLRKYHPFKINK